MQQVTEPTAPSLEKKLIHCFENVAGEFIVEEVEGFEQDVSRAKLCQLIILLIAINDIHHVHHLFMILIINVLG